MAIITFILLLPQHRFDSCQSVVYIHTVCVLSSMKNLAELGNWSEAITEDTMIISENNRCFGISCVMAWQCGHLQWGHLAPCSEVTLPPAMKLISDTKPALIPFFKLYIMSNLFLILHRGIYLWPVVSMWGQPL